MKLISGVTVVLTLIVVLEGCSSASKPASSAPAAEKPAMANGGFYAEETFKGRLYVFGTEKAHQAFKDSQQVPPIAKTYIGAGPDGQSVVLEADAKENALQERLKSEYEGRHNTKLP